MPILSFTISNQEGSRQICIIDGQPYYESTGENSKMRGVWLAFEGFAPPNSLTGVMHKPHSDPNLLPHIEDYFPPQVVEAFIQVYGDSDTTWKRYKDLKCLYTSCLLTPENNHFLPVEIRAAVKQYIGLKFDDPLLSHFTFHPVTLPVLNLARSSDRPLTTLDYEDLREILKCMGSTVSPVETQPLPHQDLTKEEYFQHLQEFQQDENAHYPEKMLETTDFAIYVHNTRKEGKNPIPFIVKELTHQSLNLLIPLKALFNRIIERHRSQQNIGNRISSVFSSFFSKKKNHISSNPSPTSSSHGKL